jgi:hypothetical protein
MTFETMASVNVSSLTTLLVCILCLSYDVPVLALYYSLGAP